MRLIDMAEYIGSFVIVWLAASLLTIGSCNAKCETAGRNPAPQAHRNR